MKRATCLILPLPQREADFWLDIEELARCCTDAAEGATPRTTIAKLQRGIGPYTADLLTDYLRLRRTTTRKPTWSLR